MNKDNATGGVNRKMPRKFTTDTYEKAITDRLVFGKSTKQIAEELNVGRSSVDALVHCFNAVKGGDWERVCTMLSGNACSFRAVEWAAKKCGVELPDIVMQAQENRYRAKQDEKPAPAQIPPPAPTDHWEEEKLLLQTLIKAVGQQNELLEQLYDVVLPKWVGDLKDNLNVNSDVITQTLKRIEDKTEAIKINVRRRGT